jgi:hypothetical protein
LQKRPYGQGNALQAYQYRKNKEQGLQQKDRLKATGFLGPLKNIPGCSHIGPRKPSDQKANREQKKKDPEQIDQGLTPWRSVGVKQIDAHMAIRQKRIAGAEHKHQSVQIDDRFLDPDKAYAEDVTGYHDNELDEHHKKASPGDYAPDLLAQKIKSLG